MHAFWYCLIMLLYNKIEFVILHNALHKIHISNYQNVFYSYVNPRLFPNK